MKYALLVSLLSLPLMAQSPSPDPLNGTVPPSERTCAQHVEYCTDADLPSVPTTCTQNNGRPCPSWLKWLVGQYPLTAEESARQQRYLDYLHQQDMHWYSGPIARRSNAQLAGSRVWWLTMAGGAAAMAVSCSRSQVSHEHWDSEVPAVAGAYALGYLAGRKLNLPTAWGPGVWAMWHYSRTAAGK